MYCFDNGKMSSNTKTYRLFTTQIVIIRHVKQKKFSPSVNLQYHFNTT